MKGDIIREIFDKLRHNSNHHLGMGDIRLTITQQEEICKEVDQIVICPNCGNYDNHHTNYDYSKKELPIIDYLCNECGTFFNSKEK